MKTLPDLKIQLNKFQRDYECTWVAAYVYHNGTVYLNGLHDIKIDRLEQSDYINPFKDESDLIAQDIPLKHLANEYHEMKENNHAYFDTRNELGYYIKHLMGRYDLKTMICVPLYKKKRPIGFLAFEYQKYWQN